MTCYPYAQLVYTRSNGKPELAVKITRGPYEGLILMFGKIDLDENNNLKYEYDILENPRNIEKTQQFFNDMAAVLIDITKLEKQRKENGWPSKVRTEWAMRMAQSMRGV